MGAAVARAALDGARRSRGAEAGGVTRDSNAHLTASSRFVDRWSREKSSPTSRAHQGSHVHDVLFLIDAHEWSQRKSEGSVRRVSGRAGGGSGIPNTPNATANCSVSGMEGTRTSSARRHASTCGSGTQPIRSGSSRQTRPGTSATGSACMTTTAAIDSPISTRSGRRTGSGVALAMRPIRPRGSSTSRCGVSETVKSHTPMYGRPPTSVAKPRAVRASRPPNGSLFSRVTRAVARTAEARS